MKASVAEGNIGLFDKSDLVDLIRSQIKKLGLTQTKAAERMGVTQSEVSKVLRGQTRGFSSERLLAFAGALGADIEISIKVAPGARQGRMSLKVEMEAA
ncbi:helix-turn-helix domain-containing protein [Methylobacterium aquaticum]|uniref:helix-turn-helix domain-containing protein n=1 Tax=Methylobacterium aquaticum TaxID=270351 RepID=UPI001932F4D1|nr:XRE family transcriptional regulator [Methylobacterium aquaticum]QRE78245.1 XRE family transcriptional regulator [Methylobacterium aquaticum]QRE78265.1 XRE family transcriptional regulator [Methylobacterium aquaticum]